MERNIDIFRPDNTKLATITFETSSYRMWQVMGEHSVNLNFSLPQIDNGLTTGFIEIPVGSYVTFHKLLFCYLKNSMNRSTYKLVVWSCKIGNK